MNQSVRRVCALSGVGAGVLLVLGLCVVGGRSGPLIATFGAALLVPWSAEMALQLRRVEGDRPVLSQAQFGLGVILAFEFFHLGPVQLVVAGVAQALTIGLVVLGDRDRAPVFPRWAGYANIGLAVVCLPAGLESALMAGRFIGNGLLTSALVAFAGWLLLNSYLMLGAIRTDRPEARAELTWSGS